MTDISVDTYRATIWIAGDYDDARRAVKGFCMAEGFCATVTRTTFIYTGGEEQGVSIGCLNYPRFPTTPEALDAQVWRLAEAVLHALNQHSVLVCSDRATRWLTRRA